MNRIKRIITVMLCVACLVLGAINVYASNRASVIISRITAGLNSDKTATLTIVAKVSCDELGTVSYSLYKSNGTLVRSQTINDFGSGLRHRTSINLADHIQNGNSYYITANFFADGETRSLTSGTRSY